LSLESIDFPEDIVLPSDTSLVRQLQERILAELEAMGLAERDLFGVKLALEEALVNAMKHGNQLDRSKTVRVSYLTRHESFYIRIIDEGDGFDPDDVPDPTLEENLERACGRGLMLMRHYMSEVRFLARGNTVLMCKNFSSNGQAKA
jgi:serine/threonine-protein kinase RsbW